MSCPIIILAAGSSSRMGKEDKLLAELGTKRVIDHVVDAARASKAAPIYLVHRPGETFADIEDVQRVCAEDAAHGQSHSIAAGLRALPEGCRGTLLCLADLPGITQQAIDAVLSAAEASPEHICRPTYADTPGHPVYWPQRFFEALTSQTGDNGAGKVLKANTAALKTFAWPEDGVVFDVDTPERLAQARQRFQ